MWRHGQTAWNVEERFQGSTDIPLDDTGQMQADRAARLLASLDPDVVVSSDLGRAQSTAAPLARWCGREVSLDPRLRETFGGSWEGRTSAEIMATDSVDYAAWRAGADVPAGGGERRSDVAARMVAAIGGALTDVPPGGVLVVVTHGGSARGALGTMLDLPVDRWSVIGGLANCCWSVLEEVPGSAIGVGWRLVEHNAGSLPEPVMSDEE